MLVKSQVVHLPLDHGTSVAPSGLFESVRRRPGGSLELGMSALKSDLHMISFIAKWRLAHALDCLQTSPSWWPLGSVVSPHWHWCGAQIFRPRRRPIATRTASLLSPKPQEAVGAVKSQSPAWGAILLVILLGRVDRCSRTKPESYQLQTKGRPRTSAW